ncbi:unnamed protein product [Linum trigynum]|uniref:ABC transporter domain-containing protein n=1 Tax=Linum trigynum TaxID=586398 RepID=A0AAV2D6Q7_9ROSI
MELRRGIPLLLQQFTALLKKNLLLSWRNPRATLIQLLAAFIFTLLLFCSDKATNNDSSAANTPAVKHPAAAPPPPIPPCDERRFFLRKPCFDFVWSGNGSARLNRIVRGIMANNPGRRIAAAKVKSFRTKKEVDSWLFANQIHCAAALHLGEVNATVITYGLQANSSDPNRMLGSRWSTNPASEFLIPLQAAAEREIARSILGDPNFKWTVGMKEFAHPAAPIRQPGTSSTTSAPAFFLAFTMFGFVLQISALVTEKELKLRQAMSTMGLYDSAYWLSWIVWEGIFAAISSLLLVLFGLMFKFDFFWKNSFAVVYLVFFLFQFNMVGYAFMLSNFISKASSATAVGFSVFIIGFITQVMTSDVFPYASNISITVKTIWSLFPPNLLAIALMRLSDATEDPSGVGISWSSRGKCLSGIPNCEMTLNDVYIWLLATAFLWFALAIYLDNIIPNAYGVRKSILYFLTPSYWIGKGGNQTEGGVCSCTGSLPRQENVTPDDEDVLEEENTVKRDLLEGTVDQTVALQIRGLVKTYAGTRKAGGGCCSCCSCKKTLPYHAIRGLSMNIAKDQLFCLLGPNGAGKTTAINCLTGIAPATSGDALIYGHSIRGSGGMSSIRKLMGVCPQFDILWDALSGEEHLHLFASIKGIPPPKIKEVAKELLDKVRLTNAAKVRSRSYSGGMKRRLSVAIALIGDPKLIILDEPTTGMDPISRRHVWDTILEAKQRSAIILTTHSMEEADVLSDRIGIMAKGRLRCIGTSIRLKSKFGAGFIANLSFVGNADHRQDEVEENGNAIHQEAVKQFFRHHLALAPTEATKSFMTFVIPRDRETLLTNLFAELEERRAAFGIGDIQLGLSTLQEVFLRIAREAELETATAEGRFLTLNLNSGASIQIPVGARFVGIPATESSENPRGVMVEVYWEADDGGSLCISGHSEEMPIPPNVQPTVQAGVAPVTKRCFFGKSQPVYGMVIDPNQITQQTS